MKKNLLITTALVAVLSTANVYARTIDSSMNNDDPAFNQDPGFHTNTPSDLADNNLIITTDVYTQFDYTIADGKKIELNEGGLWVNAPGTGRDHSLKITGGEIIATGSDQLNVKGTGVKGNGIEISGGSIKLSNADLIDDSGDDTKVGFS